MAAWSWFSGCRGGEKHGLEEVQRARTDEAVLGDGVAWMGAVFLEDDFEAPAADLPLDDRVGPLALGRFIGRRMLRR